LQGEGKAEKGFAKATRRIARRSDSKVLTGYVAGKAKRGAETHKQCIMWIRKGQGSKDERWLGNDWKRKV